MTTISIIWLLSAIICFISLILANKIKTIRNIKITYNKHLNEFKKDLEDIRQSDIVLENALDEMEARIQNELNTQMNWNFVNKKQTIKDVAKLSNPVVKEKEESDWEKSQGQDI